MCSSDLTFGLTLLSFSPLLVLSLVLLPLNEEWAAVGEEILISTNFGKIS